MSDKAAGWYPDPDGENRQRFWDGDSWTEYYTPIAPQQAELHGSSTASADYPYLVASRSGTHHGLMAAPGQVAATGGWPTAPAQGGDGETQEFTGGGKRSRANVWALVAASALVVMLVVGVGWWAFGPGGSPEDDPTDAGTDQPTDGETVTGELALGTAASATVPEAGLWVGTLTLDADATILVDARGEGSAADLRISLTAEGSNDPVAGNDDRGTELARFGGNGLNPLVSAALTAGTYEVRVDERNGAEVDFDITASAVVDELTSGETLDVEVAEDAFWAGSLTVTDAGSYSIDVTGISTSANDEPDPVIVVIGNSDRQYVNDDRDTDADDRNPLLEQDFAAGTWVVLVYDYNLTGLSAEITTTAS